MPVFHRLLVVVALFAAAQAGAAARAEPLLADGERRAVEAVILAQIEAFKGDDAAAAFAFATPALQQRFMTAANFLHAVRTGYRPVYRPARVEFLGVFFVGDRPAQRVEVTAANGRIALADYLMERQPDGEWRIAGVYLVDTRQNAL